MLFPPIFTIATIIINQTNSFQFQIDVGFLRFLNDRSELISCFTLFSSICSSKSAYDSGIKNKATMLKTIIPDEI
ncbi:hypothetical protein ES705_23589 [subsurface metagenome]